MKANDLILRARITQIDLKIADLLSTGLAIKEVADKLGLSERTVEHKMGYLRKQLGMSNNLALVAFLIRNEVIQ